MRLLLDENLSPRLVESLDDLYPGSQHVDLAGFRGQPDQAIWEYARRHDLAIVSKDNDFRQLSFLYGPVLHPRSFGWGLEMPGLRLSSSCYASCTMSFLSSQGIRKKGYSFLN